MIDNPVWASTEYLSDNMYRRLLLEFVGWDVLRAEPFSISVNGGKASLKYHEFVPHINHWSRLFEYPWAIMAAELKSTDIVLDAGGGNGLIQYAAAFRSLRVLNVDMNQEYLKSVSNGMLYSYVKNLSLEYKDLRNLGLENHFDKILCISVLEHSDYPEEILDSLILALKPGGRLIVTLDVTEKIYKDFHFDKDRARKFINRLGIKYPPKKPNTLSYNVLGEVVNDNPVYTEASVLCFYYDKV